MFMGDELLIDYRPRPAPLFKPARIVLAKGSNRTAGGHRFAERICEAYPEAEVVEAFGIPHNRVDLGESDPLRLHERGKQALVLGEHRSAVRFSDEGGNACPNYWHFSPYGFCPYGCHYCYLAGTPGVWFSPSVKIFLNLEEILGEVERTARQLGRPTAFFREEHAEYRRPPRRHAAMRPGRLSGARGGHADHPGGRLAGDLRAIHGDVARIDPVIADHPRLHLLLPAGPATHGTQARQTGRDFHATRPWAS